MLPPSASEHNNALVAVDCGLTAILIAISFAWPRLGSGWFTRVERAFGRLARRQILAVASVGLSALFLRIAILPIFPIPVPFVPDDFSFLLAADTFAHGRLTNPTPEMWTHFESFHITMQPTYMSMYFPAEGLLLAAGKILLGRPWFAVLCADALMCAAICWMLQAWIPAKWALLGGILAILRLGLFSYWVNTYTGGGPILAVGGALVLGSLPRLMKTARSRFGLLMAVGVILLALTRPYEGLLLCLPVAVALGRWACIGKNRPDAVVLLRRAAFPLALIVAALAWLGYYDYRAFGSPLTLPYTVNRATYAVAPYYIWQSQRHEPAYRHPEMRRFYVDDELAAFSKVHSRSLFIPMNIEKIWIAARFFAGFALLFPLVMLHRVLRDRRIRFLLLCVLVLVAGNLIMIFLIPHYLAAFTSVFYAIGLQAMRHLRVWSPEGKPVGATIVRLTVVSCCLLAGLRLLAEPLKLKTSEWPVGYWSLIWSGPEHFGGERAQIQSQLEKLTGNQLVIVRYSPKHETMNEWVYNFADIDRSKVVWAREMDPAANQELIRYYRDRNVWLVEPDAIPARISPYPVQNQVAAASRGGALQQERSLAP
ncbi:MAG TPA: hypothetical protein VGG85_07435 [Terracidiphilus sp.]|jgi:hypothetical protein